jgi:asparagine synthase (glutamine-hydrolysing)
MTEDGAPWRLLGCHGFSAVEPDRLVLLAAASGLTDAPGDIVLAAERESGGETETMLASSGVGSRPYFWALDAEGRLHHDVDVFSVVRSAQLPWEWDPAALHQLALLGHTLGTTTLHRKVARLPPDSVLRCTRGAVSIRAGTLWDETEPAAGHADLKEAFNASLADTLLDGEDPIVSLSAGFDSRLILAGVLRQGARPRLLTMGDPTSTDRRVASRIARALDLPLEEIELQPSEYLTAARLIVRATSGTKLASHWHTYLYARATRGQEGVHLVGSNGEFARSFYADRGLLSRAFDLSGRPGLSAQWKLRARRWARRTLLPLPARALSLNRLGEQLVEAGGRRRPLDSLDTVYTTQRVRHFVGNGLALYALSGRPASPFLDSRWIRAVRALPRKEKLGSKAHRSLILASAPRLADFEIEGRSRIESSPPIGYWLRRAHAVGYSPFREVLKLEEVAARIVEDQDLDEFYTRPERIATVQQAAPQNMELMLTLSYAAELARDAARANASG